MPVKTKNILPVIAILGAVFLWGSSFAAMRIVLRDLNPYAAMFCRLFGALFFIIPISMKIFPKSYKKGDWKILVPMVLFQPCLYFLLESHALTFTTSSQAGIIAACMPLMVAVTAWYFLSESISAKTVIGLILSISGVILLTIFQSEHMDAPNPVLGNILQTGAMFSACANVILIKKLSSNYDPWSLTGMQVVAGTLFFLPGIKYILESDPSIWTLQLILLLLYLGVFVSFLAFGLYNWGICHIKVSTASLFINLIPVTAVLFGWLVLKEILNPKQMFATAIVIAGILLSNKK